MLLQAALWTFSWSLHLVESRLLLAHSGRLGVTEVQLALRDGCTKPFWDCGLKGILTCDPHHLAVSALQIFSYTPSYLKKRIMSMHVLDSDVTELQARFLVTSQPPLSCVLCM